MVSATNSMDLIRTHGNGQEKNHVHLTSRIRYTHGLDTHTWKHSFMQLQILKQLKQYNYANKSGHWKGEWIICSYCKTANFDDGKF